jgi:hypothetical protein
MFISAPSPSVSPAYSPSEGIVVSATSLSGSPSFPPSESLESLSTSNRIVFSATSLSGSPSCPPPETFESQSTSRPIRSPSGSPSHSPSMPMKLSAKGPTLSGRIRTSSPPLGVGGISSIPSEYPRPSPFTETNVPGVTKRGRPCSPAISDVVPDAKRFAIATESDDAEVPEHLWDLRALRLDGTLITQEGNALTLLRKVLLQRWIRITTRSFLVYLNFEKVTHEIVKRDKVKYGWSMSGKSTYSTWWHGSPRAGDQDMEIGRDCVRRICDSSWWNWDGGSTPFFWRWPSEFRTQMRDGTTLWFDSTLAPAYKRPQRADNNPTLKSRVKEKLDKVLQRRYFEVGLVKSLTTFFGVPKGEDDM